MAVDYWEYLSEEERAEFARLGAIVEGGPKPLVELYPPNSEPQRMFLTTEADIAVIGGSAGGGKTIAELLEPSQDVDCPGFNAVIFRRTMKQVKDEGGIWDQSAELFPMAKARPNLTDRYWSFPSGASIQFAGLETDADKYTWKGAQICDLLFDELTEFMESQFWYLLSRNRSTCGRKVRVRASTNPAPGWVKRLLAPWVDRSFPNRAESGELRWFIRQHDQIVWLDERPAREVCTRGINGEGCFQDGCENCFPPEKSITFIRAKVYDNRDLLKSNPGYIASLMVQDEVERKRLLDGDWDAKPANLVIDAFDETVHSVSWREIPKEWRRYVGADFGLTNGAEVVLAEDPHSEALYIIAEDWPGHSRDFNVIAEKIREMAGCTPVGGAGGNRTTEQGWRQAMRKEGIPMSEPEPQHTDPKLQYKCVNDLFRSGGLYIFETCTKTIQMLGDFERKKDPKDGQITDDFDDTRFHLLAALRYICTKLRPPKGYSQYEPAVVPHAKNPALAQYSYGSQQIPSLQDLTGRRSW